ncbi:MAG: prepilin peptidase [Gemmataceae bacterium]
MNWTLQHWPIVAICAGMLAAAIIDWWKFKVPNKLTFPLIISGWVLGLLNTLGWTTAIYGGDGGIVSSLAGTLLAMALLLPLYAIGGMGAGDVKMTMGFGAWIGAFYGFGGPESSQPNGMLIIVYAFCAGAIVGGIIAACMIVLKGKYKDNAEHVREIASDFASSSGITDIAEKANSRRPRWHRLPYGVPLCIGFLGYLIYFYTKTGA